MADQNLTIGIRADASQLRADLAQAQAQVAEFGKQLRAAAKDANATGDTTALRAAAAQYQTAANNVSRLSTELKGLARSHQELIPTMAGVTNSSGQVRFALQNLSFQANDLFTGLASGQPVMRVFAQQGGQIVQAFQQGGGLSNILGAVAARAASLLTPMRALAGLGGAAAAGVALLGLRAKETDDSIRRFDVTLKALGRGTTSAFPDALRGAEGFQSAFATPSGGPSHAVLTGARLTGEQLEKVAQSLRSAGLSITDARTKIAEALRAGIPESQIDRILRIGQNLNTVLGEGTSDRFVKAISAASAGDIGPLRELAVALRLIGVNSDASRDGLNNLVALINALERRVRGAEREALDPLGRRLREVNVRFNEIADSSAEFFKEGAVNAVDTAKAFGELANAVAEWSGMKGAAQAFWDMMKAFGGWLSQTAVKDWAVLKDAGQPFLELIKSLGGYISDTFVGLWTGATEAIKTAWGDTIGAITGNVNAFIELLNSLIATAGRAATALGSALTGGPSVDGLPGGLFPAPGNAAGGLIRGPGSGTSDSILARLSNGEFVVNAAATARHLSLLHAINSGFNAPRFALGGLIDGLANIMPPPPSFAFGGLVAGGGPSIGWGGGGAAVHLHFGSETVVIQTDRQTARQVERAAQREKMLSAGRKASWWGS